MHSPAACRTRMATSRPRLNRAMVSLTSGRVAVLAPADDETGIAFGIVINRKNSAATPLRHPSCILTVDVSSQTEHMQRLMCKCLQYVISAALAHPIEIQG